MPVGVIPVFWDINRCPVPVDFDARRVGPCIERFLRKLGHCGPISICAVGILSKVPKEILEAVSSTGILLYELAFGRKSIKTKISIYFERNPPPAHVMLISPPRYFDYFLSHVAETVGHHVIFPFPTDSGDRDAKLLWDKLLLEEDVKRSKALEPYVCAMCGYHIPGVDDLEESSKTVEPANRLCLICRGMVGNKFFSSSQEHAQEEQKQEDELEVREEFFSYCQEHAQEEQEDEQEDELVENCPTWVCGVCLNLPGRGFENFLAHLASEVHAELEQVDDLDDNPEHPSQDDNPEEFHWFFRDKTESMLSYEEITIAENALKILQTEY